jgi:hypothetical protein
VCESVAEPYADKLLKLPKFLRPDHSPLIDITLQDMREALTLTAYFMRKHIFDAINKPLPISRENLIDKFKDNV